MAKILNGAVGSGHYPALAHYLYGADATYDTTQLDMMSLDGGPSLTEVTFSGNCGSGTAVCWLNGLWQGAVTSEIYYYSWGYADTFVSQGNWMDPNGAFWCTNKNRFGTGSTWTVNSNGSNGFAVPATGGAVSDGHGGTNPLSNVNMLAAQVSGNSDPTVDFSACTGSIQ